MDRILSSVNPRMSPPAFFSRIPSIPSSHALAAAKLGIPSSRVLQSFRLISNASSPDTVSPYKENADLCLLQFCTLPVESKRNPLFICNEGCREFRDSFFSCSNDKEFRVLKRLHFPYKDRFGFQALASCNGLVLLMQGGMLVSLIFG